MARDFDDAASDTIAANGAAATLSALGTGTVHIWLFGDGLPTSNAAAFTTSDKTENDSLFQLTNLGGTNQMEVFIREGGVNDLAALTGVDVDDGAWHSMEYSTDSGGNDVFIDGVDTVPTYSSGSSSTQSFFSHVQDTDEVTICGAVGSTGLRTEWDGRLFHVCVWSVRLTSKHFAALDRGAHPFFMAGTKPSFFVPVDGDESPEPNYAEPASTGTVTGTTRASGPTVELLENYL